MWLRAATSNAWSAFVATLELFLFITATALVVLLQTTFGLALVVSSFTIRLEHARRVENHGLLVRVGLHTSATWRLDGALILVTRVAHKIWQQRTVTMVVSHATEHARRPVLGLG